MLNNSSVENEIKYEQYRNILTNVLRDANKFYFQKSFEENKYNGKKTWQLLGEALNRKSPATKYPSCFVGDGNEIYENEDIAAGFNDFFASIGENLEQSIPPPTVCPLSNLTNPTYPTFSADLITSADEIVDIIKSLNSVAGGIDKISTAILLGTYQHCLHHLVYFFNLCLSTAVFPDGLKIALIKPVFKAGDTDKFTNYRPISLLPILSKILEKKYS